MSIAQEKEQLVDVVNGLIQAALARLHTIAVVKVTSIAADKKTIDCRIVWNLVHPGGADEQFCEFVQVPLVFLGGGSSSLTFPVTEGDYGLLFITERCFDRWWGGRDFVKPAYPRMHNYSDGFCLVGVRPAALGLAIPDETTLRGVVRLGTVAPGDTVALASKVETELQTLRDDVEAIKSAFNLHTHAVVVPAVPFAGTSGTGPSVAAGSDPGSVGSAYVEAD